MTGQGGADRTSADIFKRDGIIGSHADRTINQVVDGGNARFLFTNVGELGDIITRLAAVRERTQQASADLYTAGSVIYPPAQDAASQRQADAAIRSLAIARAHNIAVQKELDTYLHKLHQAKAQLVDTDRGNAGTLSRHDGG